MQVMVTKTHGMLATNEIGHTEAPANTAIYKMLAYKSLNNSSNAMR